MNATEMLLFPSVFGDQCVTHTVGVVQMLNWITAPFYFTFGLLAGIGQALAQSVKRIANPRGR
jgi:hypothetical protein